MTEVVMIKNPRKLNFSYGDDRPSIDLPAEQVVGLSLPASPTVWEHGHKTSGSEIEEALHLEDTVASRLVDFFEQTRARHLDERPFYSCHVLAVYVTGALTQLRASGDNWTWTSDAEVVRRNRKMTPGQTYGMWSEKSEEFTHSVLGTHSPRKSLSILGNYGILAVADNDLLMKAYDGDEIYKTTSLAIEEELKSLHIKL